MLYLFNNSADPKTSPKDIWLTGSGKPVFVTALSESFSAIPQGSKLVGNIDSAHPEQYQLSKDGKLTQAGQSYCNIMGVEKTSSSLTKFISTKGHRHITISSVIGQPLDMV